MEEERKRKEEQQLQQQRQRRPSRFEVIPAPDILKIKQQSNTDLLAAHEYSNHKEVGAPLRCTALSRHLIVAMPCRMSCSLGIIHGNAHSVPATL